MEKSLALSRAAMKLSTTVVFIDVDGVVKSELRFKNGQREWIRYEEPKEVAAG
jgi:hypothetical protein